jgi:hypothetical protein
MLSKIAEEVEVADGIQAIILENGHFPTKMLIKGIDDQDPQTKQMVLVSHSCKQVATLQTAKITQVLDVKADQKYAIETRIQEFTGMPTSQAAFKISEEFTNMFRDNKQGITGYVCYTIPQLKELIRRTRAAEFGDWQSAIMKPPLSICHDVDSDMIRTFMKFNIQIDIDGTLHQILGWAHPGKYPHL